MSDFNFQLSKELAYTKDGNPNCKTCTLEFVNPGMDEYDQVSDLSQMVMNSMMEAAKHAPKDAVQQEDDKVPTASEIKVILFAAKETKFRDVAKSFKALCLKTGTVDGSIKITDLLISKLSISDYTKLVCEYIANFIVPSLFSDEL